LPGNDVDFFLHGVSELTPSMQRQARVLSGALAAQRPLTGHVIDLPQPIALETGHVVAKN
jgi:hypothetical protein